MRDEVNSLILQRDNILKLLSEYERKIKELNEKIKDEHNTVEIETVQEVLKIKNKILSKKTCWFYRRGYCKKGIECKYIHEPEDCVRYLELSRCEDINCNLRHRKDCKFWKKGNCFRRYNCAYLHREVFRNEYFIENVNPNENYINCKTKHVKQDLEILDEANKCLQDMIKKDESEKVKVNEENDYLKKQITRFRDRNIKLDLKAMENGDTMTANESEIKTLKEKNGKLNKKINEILQQRFDLESEIDHLKRRLGEDILDEESESD